MNLLLLVNKYWPEPEANGLCAYSIIRSLNPDYLTVICKSADQKQEGIVLNEKGKKIICVRVPEEKLYNRRNIIGKAFYIVKHLCGSFVGSLPDKKAADVMYRQAAEEIKKTKYDWMISTLNPIEAVEAGVQIKKDHPEINLMIYDLDSASNCSIGMIEKIFKRQYNRKVFKWEKKAFSAADIIVHLMNHKEHFSQERYHPFQEKMLYQEVPLLEIRENTASPAAEEKRIIYAGAFYHRLREPAVLLDIIKLAARMDPEIILDIYTKKKSIADIDVLESNNILVHDYISQELLDEKIAASGALISLGNKSTTMFPSKTVSYVSALKPIIHIYQSDEDPVIDYLSSYPCALLIDGRNNPEENAEKVVRFLNQSKRAVSKEDVKRLYFRNTGEHCAEEIKRHCRERGLIL